MITLELCEGSVYAHTPYGDCWVVAGYNRGNVSFVFPDAVVIGRVPYQVAGTFTLSDDGRPDVAVTGVRRFREGIAVGKIRQTRNASAVTAELATEVSLAVCENEEIKKVLRDAWDRQTAEDGGAGR